MPAILYLMIGFFTGWVIKLLFRIDTAALYARISGSTRHLPPLWVFDIPFSFIVGLTVMTTVHYYLSFLFSLVLPSSVNPLLASNIAFAPLLAAFFLIAWRKWIRKPAAPAWSDYFSRPSSFYKNTLFFFTFFSVFVILYSFFVYNGYLNSGATVFSDFAPHTAVISSFANGNNFPTQYPHFAGEGIQYHFMFFYLCGNLEYLGFRIDLAMNIPSILGILCFVLLLGCLGVLLTRRRWVFFLAPFMLFFRSSYAIFSYLQELIGEKGATIGSVLSGILRTDKFIGQTLHDDWGLWSLNVYANQRHFLWGFSILLIVMFLFLPSVQRLGLREKQGALAVGNPQRRAVGRKFSFFIKSVLLYLKEPSLWRVQNRRETALCILLVTCLPYWHGSVLVSIFCLLMVMVFFSRNRLSFLAVAAAGVFSAVLQARFFSGGAGNVASPSFLWGFLSSDLSLPGVALYLFQVLGISFLFLLILPFLQREYRNRVFITACIAPLLFALTVSLTPDVTVNHKYIIIAIALANIFIADLFCIVLHFTKSRFTALGRALRSSLSKKPDSSRASRSGFSRIYTLPVKLTGFLLAAVLTLSISFALFATGVPELIGYINKNGATVKIDLNSPLTKWIEENTRPQDVFLTAPYDMNEFFFSGRKVFYGWPYFSWSAGYDTAVREVVVRKMFLGYDGNLEEFMANVRKQGIRFVIFDDALTKRSGYEIDSSFFEANFSVAVRFPSIRNTIIYQLY